MLFTQTVTADNYGKIIAKYEHFEYPSTQMFQHYHVAHQMIIRNVAGFNVILTAEMGTNADSLRDKFCCYHHYGILIQRLYRYRVNDILVVVGELSGYVE